MQTSKAASRGGASREGVVHVLKVKASSLTTKQKRKVTKTPFKRLRRLLYLSKITLTPSQK